MEGQEPELGPCEFHVLAVDDSLLDRKLLERLLTTSSFQVTSVDSGSKALEFLGLLDSLDPSPHQQHDVKVNLIITDYCMPGMTGYDLLKKIKESSSYKDIPVVIMSSENLPSRISRCLEGGAEEFLLKPVQLSDMNRLRPHLLKSQTSCEDKMNNGCERETAVECESMYERESPMNSGIDEYESESPARSDGGHERENISKRISVSPPSERRRPKFSGRVMSKCTA
ncbi:hypothetical protein AMTRI_Chr04g250380 [Amborella trichopoda]|uniref:Response regulatory domain-containing protein n=1 Tax=Amborella trichopoda TaxID=13333 RepID=W1P068_AMBTC|nr:two-component response regulator ORR3 [Amborella trichopoda]ERN00961.1 hypothetical protein AMTR_s00002p00074510 [Amborella trichopoda]|eukprot:XP_006838392.1 two-component response regulator ORR3 [Amborella trichopoda]